ncbi:MAG TPA: hypothetical protein VL463_24110 [Kofleriaceae bacterium]|nr:hypothetical protein [Kofleriaceae bacterium]
MHPLMAQFAQQPEKRTTIQLQVYQDPWALIAGWGQHHKWKTIGPAPEQGLWVMTRGWANPAPQNIAFHLEGYVLTLQAWVRFSGMERLRSFFILPAEINISSGGRGLLARRSVRNDVNELLGHLGAPQLAIQ